MSTFRKGISVLALFAVVAAAGLLALVSNSTAAAGPSANGHGTLTNPDGTKRQFTFNARTNADGTVSGHAVLRNPAFDGDNGKTYYVHLDISCLKVIGNIAIMGGTESKTNDPIDTGYFSVQDNGEPGKNDKISRVFFWDDDPTTTGPPEACQNVGAADFPLETIESGNIQVRG